MSEDTTRQERVRLRREVLALREKYKGSAAEPTGAWFALNDVLDLLASLTASAPGVTHCENCGCDWLDNGLNPIGCPYCAPATSAFFDRFRASAPVDQPGYDAETYRLAPALVCRVASWIVRLRKLAADDTDLNAKIGYLLGPLPFEEELLSGRTEQVHAALATPTDPGAERERTIEECARVVEHEARGLFGPVQAALVNAATAVRALTPSTPDRIETHE